MDKQYDFSGWVTRNNLACADGRTIRKDAFKHCDGKTVPLVWNHRHDEPGNVLGRALLENRVDGVYGYCFFNDTENGRAAKELVKHGDVEALSIYANGLKQTPTRDVIYGDIKEVSLVVAGANPGAFIDFVDLAHGDDGYETELFMGTGEPISLYHSEDKATNPPKSEENKSGKESDGKPEDDGDGNSKSKPDDDNETIADVIATMSDKQKDALFYAVARALGEADNDEDEDDPKNKSNNSEGGRETMKHNVFEQGENKDTVLSHAVQQDIINLAKQNSVGSLRAAINIFTEQAIANGDNEMMHSLDALQHGIDNIESLFPDYKDLRPGAPELLTRDQGWVTVVMNKIHKTPISRIRTRQMDARNARARAQGYQKGKRKTPAGNMNMVSRTTDPQTVYCTDALHRDDIVDITDFDVVEYQFGVMKGNLYEELAVAIMVGDGRDADDEMKISEEHIRSIWNDDDLYTIHYDVDIDAAKSTLQGTNTGANFGENYIYSEAIVAGALHSREKYKGSGSIEFYCTPHLVNVMLLARDLNGRRIYDSVSDLAKTLNVGAIHTAEQFEDLIRVDKNGDKHRLLGIFVDLKDYSGGCVKGGQITRFDQFDIDFNQHKFLIETRMSGALTRLYSAIALEEPVKSAPVTP